jgi:DNA repair exonuclease SbcCD ATPase subunit
MKRVALVALVAVLGTFACDDPQSAASDEVTIVVQGDRRELEQQEKALKEREDSLQQDKLKLDGRIAELARSLKAAADAEQRRRLEEELRRQKDLEGAIGVQVSAIAAQKNQVAALKNAKADPAPPAREVLLAVRESHVAEREALLARQERDLAERLKDVAQREKAVAAFERQAPPEKLTPKAASLTARHKKVLAELDARGILVSDLPPEAQPLNAEIYAARRQGDLARAADLLVNLSAVVAKFKVDQRFVEQKIGRLQGARAAANLSDPQRQEVEKLLRDVTSSFSDGKYDQANRGLNRIAAILDVGDAKG